MSNKRLALNKDGKLTYCTATEENLGKGRCNHLLHQSSKESMESFLERIDKEILNLNFEGEQKFSNKNLNSTEIKELQFNKQKDEFIKLQKQKFPMAGAQDKFYYENRIYKLDNENELMGNQHNALSEEMVTIVESYIKDFNYVGYSTTKVVWNDCEKVAASSQNFIKENESFVDIRALIGEKESDKLIKDDFNFDGVDRQSQLENFVSIMENLGVKDSKN